MDFREFLRQGFVVLDGATGSNLQQAGMKSGDCPEQWIAKHPEVFIDLQCRYIEAGSDVLYTPTFTCNRIKLDEYGLASKQEELTKTLVGLTKEAIRRSKADRKIYVAGDISMTGQQLEPIGSMPFEELVDVYKQQVRLLAKEGVDLFAIETMMSLQECRAALLAVKETCDIPALVTLTYQEDGRTLYGTSPETALVVLQSMGADAIGINCSTGPDKMVDAVKAMAEYACVPLVVKPNAGLPFLQDGVTCYDMDAESFSEAMMPLVDVGATVLGGCCGTTPQHIQKLVSRLKEKKAREISERKSIRALTTERNITPISLDGRFRIVGERINPTGKKELQEKLRAGDLSLVMDMAEEQEKLGASILDVNMGMNGIDEKEMMLRAVNELTMTVDLPLSIDSSYVDVVESALRIYPGRALINSISLEKEKFEKLLPIAKKYGAMFILLPLSDEGLPKDAEEKRQIVRTILDAALKIGLHKEDIIVDGLVATVGANPLAALECFDTIQYCKDELGLATACGLSNISFGLPERIYVNSAFLTMAIAKGLTMAIANPSQDLLMNAAVASDMLLHKEGSDIRYINRMNQRAQKEAPATDNAASAGTLEPANPVFDCVLKGNKGNILKEVDKALAAGEEPGAIINGQLIPAINEVGVLFDKQIYFLPQLISSAQTMQHAIEYLEPMLSKDKDAEPKATIIIATVEGDIHDIGKNLVALMLRNYGYRVLDLGKDVAADIIVDTALKENAQIIGLSALMTTTMMRMKDVVELAKERGCNSKIIVGGAAITQSFADEIGADGYSPDAADCVKLVERLLEEM